MEYIIYNILSIQYTPQQQHPTNSLASILLELKLYLYNYLDWGA